MRANGINLHFIMTKACPRYCALSIAAQHTNNVILKYIMNMELKQKIYTAAFYKSQDK